jgi:LysM repeat protein
MITHKVTSGETLVGIQKKYGITSISLEDIKKLNPQIKDVNKIQAGWQIKLPSTYDELKAMKKLNIGIEITEIPKANLPIRPYEPPRPEVPHLIGSKESTEGFGKTIASSGQEVFPGTAQAGYKPTINMAAKQLRTQINPEEKKILKVNMKAANFLRKNPVLLKVRSPKEVFKKFKF